MYCWSRTQGNMVPTAHHLSLPIKSRTKHKLKPPPEKYKFPQKHHIHTDDEHG